MRAGLDWISISVDGTGETYERIRNPLKFDETVAKIKAYHEIKKKYQGKEIATFSLQLLEEKAKRPPLPTPGSNFPR